jgi:hypothetical protein
MKRDSIETSYAGVSLGTCRIGRGSIAGSAGSGASTLGTSVGELATATDTGSAGCAQQAHVAQVGGQAESACSWDSPPVHGSATTRPTTPDMLAVSAATRIAKASRRTGRF